MIGLITKPKVGVQLNRAHPLARNLVGYWLMNEGGGSRVHDISGSGNHGTCTNMLLNGSGASGWAGSPRGGCLNFDGVDDFVVSLNNIGISGAASRTVSMWIYPKSSSGRQTLFITGAIPATTAWGFEYNGFQGGPQNIYIIGFDADVYTVATLPLNTWSHVVATYSGGLVSTGTKLYYNGVSQVLITYQNATLNATNSVGYIGMDGILVRQRFNGLIDEVRVYNRALSAGEILMLYANPHIDLLYPSAQKHFRMA